MNTDFASRLVRWQRSHGRHDLPWQVADPYRVWLSEIMLQQTQVATVIPYFERFVASFPSVVALAQAPLDDVLAHWAGLGYYSRARNLHKAAQAVVNDHGGQFPGSAAQLVELPGIGRSTAAAIAGFCFGERTPILDGNVKRVLARWAGIDGFPGERKIEQRLWQLAEALLPAEAGDMPAFTQGMMDLGATVCSRSKPQCQRCPLRDDCRAHIEGRQAELPTRKAKAALPERDTLMLLIGHQDRLLLQQRPPTGIWGGLWSLPELAVDADPQQEALRRWGLSLHSLQPQAVLSHTFTHFRLHMLPLWAQCQQANARVAEDGWRWCNRQQALALGLPTPVRQLLLAYWQSH